MDTSLSFIDACIDETILTKHPELIQEYSFETKVSILATTISNPMWCEVYMRMRKSDMYFFRLEVAKKTKQTRAVSILKCCYQNIIGVMLHPDSYEIRLEQRHMSGWYTFQCKSGIDYETIVDLLQTHALEPMYKNIVFTYKTRQQDKRYGLIPQTEKDVGKFEEQLVQKPYKHGTLTFRITRSKGFHLDDR